MNVTGMGVVFAGGAGVPALRAALLAGKPLEPKTLERENVPVLAVPPAALTGNPVLAPARRADRFCKMTLLAAMEAWQGCVADPRRTGLILATAFGPHATVFRFVNEMLEFGDAKTSPTVFSQSVHAAAASMVATAAGLHGPTLNLADLAMPFEEALTLAECWLAGGRCDAVLVGAADELSDVLAHVVRRKWPQAHVLGEGAVFFRLEREGGVCVSVGGEVAAEAACRLVDTGALGGDAAAHTQSADPVRSHTALWGSTRIGAALHLAAAVLMRREGVLLPEAAPLGPGCVQVVSACGPRRRVITVRQD
jgi:3-oxoacyl-[acyl-carrier-protein] synthase II